MSKNSKINDFLYGILKGNPVLVLMIGLCPVLAISTTVFNGAGMSLAVAFVLVGSNVIVSLLRKFTPREIRIPIFIIVISTFVTTADYIIKAYSPQLHSQLGVFIPLIVVNCIIIGRAEAFAYKNTVLSAFLDAIGTSIGFFIVLVLISAIREVSGQGGLFGIAIFSKPAIIMALPPGGFITIGILMSLEKAVREKIFSRKRKISKEKTIL
ncbi:MAG: electron transport complex subunit RsxE [Elusimicrobiota bacterium]|nr:electron transport complex subunit RsxE [Elusimicrobiota bacterium]